MSATTAIQWTDATWSPVTGCSVVSPGCTNCYAMRLAGTRLRNHPSRAGLTEPSKAGPVWTGEVRLNEAWLDQPLRWQRPRRIFVCAHGDLFHEAVPDEWIDMVFGVMASAPQHTFQVLTKRPERMRSYLRQIEAEGPARLRHYIDVTMAPSRAARAALPPPRLDEPPPPTQELRALYDRAIAAMRAAGIRPHENRRSGVDLGEYHWRPWPLPNVWLGVSVEDQQRADERIPLLLATPAAVRWISAEPLLGPIDLAMLPPFTAEADRLGVRLDALRPGGKYSVRWVVAGGESGPGSRPMHPDWARSLRDQCTAASVPFFFKQWGAWLPWEPEQGPCWRSQAGQAEDQHALFPTDIADDPPGWDSGLRYIAAGEGHAAFQRVGKKRAGRMLDGALRDQMPALPERRP